MYYEYHYSINGKDKGLKSRKIRSIVYLDYWIDFIRIESEIRAII